MTALDEQRPSTWGEAMAAELLWVHGKIRHDLSVIQQLALDVPNGLPAEQIRQEIAELQTNSPLWKLRVNCLYYCRIVHTHHRIEDALLFPALRRSNASLDPIVDRLESDHRRVSDHLDSVEQGADRLIEEDTQEDRAHLVDALNKLSDHLLAHLDFEEESILPTMRAWERWPERQAGVV